MRTRLISSMSAVPASFAQGSQNPPSPFDDLGPYSSLSGSGAQNVPTSASEGWHFDYPLHTAPDTYPQVFRAVSCGAGVPSKYIGVSYRQLHTPEGTQDYAVQLSVLTAYPNNITGASILSQFMINADQ